MRITTQKARGKFQGNATILHDCNGHCMTIYMYQSLKNCTPQILLKTMSVTAEFKKQNQILNKVKERDRENPYS